MLVDRAGQRVGRLTVLGSPHKKGSGRQKWYWLCKCDCGTTLSVAAQRLSAGGTKSCGCLRKEAAAAQCRSRTTHGMGSTRIYNIWRKMQQRCTDPANPAWKDYGGRGISVCNEWLADPAAFQSWAEGNGYKPSLTIERIDNNGNYEPSNCRWASRVEQNHNKRNNFNIQVGAVTKCVSEWQAETGICRKVIANRIRAGIAPELAVSLHGHSARRFFGNPSTTVREKVRK